LLSFISKEEGNCFFKYYDNLKTQMSVSRIMLDFLLEKAISKGLIQKKIIDGLFEETITLRVFVCLQLGF
jgi:hypothetical protein